MARLTTNIPNLGIDLIVENVVLLKNVTYVHITNNRLVAQVSGGLTDKKYNEIAKQLRILFSISFEHVYSEDYDVSDPPNAIGYSGHNERKLHLLTEQGNLNENFEYTAKEIFKDSLETSATIPKQTRFFNLAYIWSRAHELEDLKLHIEAYVQYWRILDEMRSKGDHVRAIAALQSFGLEKTTSNVFAARVITSIDREQKKSASGEIADIAKLDRLRHPHAHQAGSKQKYYLEEETHLEAMINNWLISDITKLFILWQLDLSNYFLNPRANIYEIKKHED